MAKPKSAGAERAARTRRLKKRIAEIMDERWHDAFEEAFRLCARENPKGLASASVRWIEQAWRNTLKRPGGSASVT